MSEINLRAKFDVSDVRKGAEEYIKSIKNVETSTETASHETQKSLKGLRETVRKQMDDVKNSITESSLDIRAQINVIKNLQTEINKLRSARDKAAPGESKSSLNIQINSAKAELEGERAALVQLQSKQESAKRTLNDLKNKYREYSEQLKSSAKTTSKYSEAFKLLPQPIQNAVNATKALTKAAAAFIATPLGLILGALVLSYKAVTLWANNSAEGQIAFARSSAYLDGILKKLQNTAMSVGKSIYMAFSDPKQAAKDFGQSLLDNVTGRFKAVGKGWQSIMKIFSGEFKEGINGTLDSFVEMTTGVSDLSKKVSGYVTESEKMALANQKIKESEIALAKSRREASITLVDYESKIAEARRKATDRTLDNKERLQANEEAKQMIQERFDLERDLAEEELRIQKEKINLKGRDNASIDELNEEAALTVKLKKLDKERFNALRELNETSGTVRREIISAQKASAQATVDLELKAQRERLAILQESKNKSIALIELETKERLAAIAKEEKALIEQNKKAGINGLTKKQSEEFTVRRQVVSDDEAQKRTKLEKKYKEETQKQYEELTDIFLTEEERKTAAVERRYRELRKANEEQYKNELAAIEATKTGPEKEQAQKEATAQYEETKVLIDKAEVQENLNEVLEKYKSFSQQRLEIEEQYNRDIKVLQDQLSKATTDEQKKRIEESIKVAKENQIKEVSSINLEEFQKEIDWSAVFGNLDKLSTDSLRLLRDKIKEYLSTIGDAISKEDLKTVVDAFDNLDAALTSRNPIEGLTNSFTEYKIAAQMVAEAQKKVNDLQAKGDKSSIALKKATQELTEAQNARRESLTKMTQAVNDIGEKGEQVVQAGNNIVDMLTNLGVEVPESISGALSGLGQITSSLASIDITKPFSLITGATGMLAGLGKTIGSIFGIGKKDNKAEKRIQNLQKEVEKLDKAYQKLEEDVNSSYSMKKAEAIDAENENLQKQNELIQQQIAEEQSKKKTDQGKIDEWNEVIEANNAQIEKNKQLRIDAIMGSDIQSAIDDFANAYADAWAAGDDRAKASKDLVKKMIKQMIIEAMKMDIETPLQDLREKMVDFYKDGIIDAFEQSQLESIAEGISDDLDKRYGWADRFMKDENEEELKRQTGTISETITEQTAQESMGIWRGSYDTLKAIDQKVLTFHESYKATMTTCNNILNEIAVNTGNTANNTYVLSEMNDTLSRMDGRLRTLENNSNKKYTK